MGSLKILSIFMTALVVTLPIYTAFVLGSINSVRVEDKDGIDGYVAESGDYFKILAMLDSQTDKANLRISYPSNLPFDECHADGGQYACTYTSDIQDLNSGRYSFAVTQYDSTGQQVDKAENEFYVDGEKPVVDNLTGSQSGSSMRFSYHAADTACQGCTGMCSGIKEIVLMQDSNVIKTFMPEGGSCGVSGSGEIPLSILGVGTGIANICMKAVDNMGLESEKRCISSPIDSEKPDFDGGLFSLTDTGGLNISYVPALPLDAVVSIPVSDPHLDPDSVSADLSALNSITGSKYRDAKGRCKKDGNEYICTWDVTIDKASGSLSLYFSASDTSGNNVTYAKKILLKSDNSKPQIEGVSSNSVTASQPLMLKSGTNTLTIELDASGSGYYKKDVTLDLSALGGQSSLRADSCNLKGNHWFCEFHTTLSNTQGFEGYLTVHAKDDAGNSKDSGMLSVVFDNNKPVIKDVSLSSDCAVAGEGLTVDVTVQDETNVTMQIDAGGISTLENPVAGDCIEDSSGKFDCTVSIYGLYTDYTKDVIGINVTDRAGNTAERDYSVEICESAPGAPPNLVSVQLGDITAVDKRLLSFLPTTVYIPVYFRTNAQIIRNTVSCTGSSQNHFLNIGSKETTLSSRLDKQSVGENASSITIDCIMDLVMKKGRKVYSTPETEKVNITIPLYNNPLGEISESMKGKIADVNGEIKGLQDDIDKWEQWNMWLSMLCSMAESLGKLNSLLESIKSIMWAVDCAWSGNPITKAAAVAHWIQGCATITKYNFYVESFVWPTGLIGPSPIGMSVKYGCMLYSCRLCDWSTYMSVGVSAAGAALSPKTVQDTGWTTLSDDQNILGDGQNEMMLKPFSTGNWRWTGGETYTISHDEVDLGGDIIPEAEPGSSGDLPLLGSLTNPSYKDYWADSAKKTELLSTGDSSKWIYDPYKSIHYATACLCLPGYIYNLKKDRQIKCLYRTCLEDSSKAGLPTDTCDESYAERECLYVDSAQFKEHGYMPAFDNMINALVQMLPSIVIGIAYSASCPDFKIDPVGFSCQEVPGDVCTNARAATCGLSGAAAAILEMSDIMSGGLSFSKYNTDLGGTDYCSGGSQ